MMGKPELQEREGSCGQLDRRWELLLEFPAEGDAHACSPAPGRGTPQPAGENRHWGLKLFSGTNCVWRFMGEKQEEQKEKRQSKEKVWLSPLPFLQFGFFLNYWSFWVGVCSWCGQHPRCQRICRPAVTGLSRLSLLIIFSELMLLIL